MKRVYTAFISGLLYPVILIFVEYLNGSGNLLDLLVLYFVLSFPVFLICGIPLSILIDNVLYERIHIKTLVLKRIVIIVSYSIAGVLATFILLLTVSEGRMIMHSWSMEDVLTFMYLSIFGVIGANLFKLVHTSLNKIKFTKESIPLLK